MKNIKSLKSVIKISQSDCFFTMLDRLGENIIKLNNDDIQHKRGVYIFWGWNDLPIRIGKATKLRNRILSYATNISNRYVFDDMYNDIQYVSVIYTGSEQETNKLELDLLHKHKPKYNYHNLNL